MADAAAAMGDNRLKGIAAARDCFYRGEIADLIGAASNRVGGILTKLDLENYQDKYSETSLRQHISGIPCMDNRPGPRARFVFRL